MDLHRMITELQAERQRLDDAIAALERLSSRTAARRGRPPSWLKEIQKLKAAEKQSETEIEPALRR